MIDFSSILRVPLSKLFESIAGGIEAGNHIVIVGLGHGILVQYLRHRGQVIPDGQQIVGRPPPPLDAGRVLQLQADALEQCGQRLGVVDLGRPECVGDVNEDVGGIAQAVAGGPPVGIPRLGGRHKMRPSGQQLLLDLLVLHPADVVEEHPHRLDAGGDECLAGLMERVVGQLAELPGGQLLRFALSPLLGRSAAAVGVFIIITIVIVVVAATVF